jgi:hypothetical protein
VCVCVAQWQALNISDDTTVLCNFLQTWKIQAPIFDTWMEVMHTPFYFLFFIFYFLFFIFLIFIQKKLIFMFWFFFLGDAHKAERCRAGAVGAVHGHAQQFG